MADLTAIKRKLREAHALLIDAETAHRSEGRTIAAERCRKLAHGIGAEIEMVTELTKMPVPARVL